MRRVEAVKPRVSFADLQRMPDDGNRYELYDGELRVVPSPLPIHQRVVQRLLIALVDCSRTIGGEAFHAPFDIVLSEFDVVQPDIIYFGSAAAGRIRLREHVRFRPDLAIEVLSPSTARIDRGRKRELLARYGVPEYWIVDPDARQIDIWVLTGAEYKDPRIIRSGRYESPTLPGLMIDVEPLFAGLE
jgi:Uma2 family endonuclease